MQVKVAGDNERREIFRQVHSVWPHHPDPKIHLERRLASIQHRRATWFAGMADGHIVASCGAYPYHLASMKTQAVPARVFGAVFTPEQHRGRGYASKLLNEVMAYYETEGVRDFLLYSDIGTEFYEKLGFVALPSYEWCVPIQGEGDGAAEVGQGQELSELPQWQEAGFACGFERNSDFARWIAAKQTGDLSCWNPENLTVGSEPAYLLSQVQDGTYLLLETNLSQEPEDWALFVNLLREDARRRGAHVARGWWTAKSLKPSEHQTEILPRDKEILMWKRGQKEGSTGPLSSGFRAYLSEHV
jgi:GNAT superfamily N-acetyltransferase